MVLPAWSGAEAQMLRRRQGRQYSDAEHSLSALAIRAASQAAADRRRRDGRRPHAAHVLRGLELRRAHEAGADVQARQRGSRAKGGAAFRVRRPHAHGQILPGVRRFLAVDSPAGRGDLLRVRPRHPLAAHAAPVVGAPRLVHLCRASRPHRRHTEGPQSPSREPRPRIPLPQRPRRQARAHLPTRRLHGRRPAAAAAVRDAQASGGVHTAAEGGARALQQRRGGARLRRRRSQRALAEGPCGERHVFAPVRAGGVALLDVGRLHVLLQQGEGQDGGRRRRKARHRRRSRTGARSCDGLEPGFDPAPRRPARGGGGAARAARAR
mmetsp:Transcript_38062/g.123157  ORF Transcript_38062/g.123157 Transcript_38062/m.123157 type:complete len:324 (-) Transcript_38062:1284-2255(-)